MSILAFHQIIIHLPDHNPDLNYKPTMQVKESHLEGALHHSKPMDDELEYETLSLCDLPLYSDDQYHHLQRGESEQDIYENEEDFEFSSQELSSFNTTTTTSSFPHDQKIIFCGKLITYKQPNLPEKESPTIIECKDQAKKTQRRTVGLFKWTRGSTTAKSQVPASKNGDKSLMPKNNNNHVSKSQAKKHIGKEYNGVSAQKVSILTSSSSGKAKWHLFLFGISSFSTKIELRDMKSRFQKSGQSQSRISPTFRFYDYEDEEKACQERNRGWGLFELIRTMNCGRNN